MPENWGKIAGVAAVVLAVLWLGGHVGFHAGVHHALVRQYYGEEQKFSGRWHHHHDGHRRRHDHGEAKHVPATSLGDVELAPMYGNYHIMNTESLQTGSVALVFTAETTNDVHVALLWDNQYQESVAVGSELLEVVIGGWSDSMSVFRARSQGPDFARLTNQVFFHGDNETAHTFWVKYDYDEGSLAFGTGYRIGHNVALQARVPESVHHPMRFIALSSWNVPVKYTDIMYRELPSYLKETVEAPKDGARFHLESQFGTYTTWNADWKSTTGSLWMIFEAKASNDIHVALLPASAALPLEIPNNSQQPLHEIVIGGWGNSKSVFRTKTQTPKDGYIALENTPVCKKEGQQYWIRYQMESGVLECGIGTRLGENLILTSKVPVAFSVGYFSFSTWDVPIDYNLMAFGSL